MRLVLLPLALLLVGGCIGEGPTLYLEYTLWNLGSADRDASPGPHCGTARVEGETAVVERSAYKEVGRRRPFLIVEPDLADGPYYFVTTGTEGYPASLPAVIDPNIGGEDAGIAQVDERMDVIYVDGEPVTLPHSWTREEAGNWRADFRLSEGPARIQLFRMQSCM